MIIRHKLPTCDECAKDVETSFHAILGGKVYRLCSENCRSLCRATYVLAQPVPMAGSRNVVDVREGGSVAFLRAAHGEEWG
jgi:hypothetical protein